MNRSTVVCAALLALATLNLGCVAEGDGYEEGSFEDGEISVLARQKENECLSLATDRQRIELLMLLSYKHPSPQLPDHLNSCIDEALDQKFVKAPSGKVSPAKIVCSAIGEQYHYLLN